MCVCECDEMCAVDRSLQHKKQRHKIAPCRAVPICNGWMDGNNNNNNNNKSAMTRQTRP